MKIKSIKKLFLIIFIMVLFSVNIFSGIIRDLVFAEDRILFNAKNNPSYLLVDLSAIIERQMIQIIKASSNVNEIDNYYYLEQENSSGKKNMARISPLHFAVLRNYKRLAGCLLSLGANINIQDSMDNTPLHYAADLKSFEFIKFFLQNTKCNLSIKNHNEVKVKHLILEAYRDIGREVDGEQIIKAFYEKQKLKDKAQQDISQGSQSQTRKSLLQEENNVKSYKAIWLLSLARFITLNLIIF